MKKKKWIAKGFKNDISYKKNKDLSFVNNMYIFENLDRKYCNVDRLSNLNQKNIPNKNKETLILTTKYINSTEILDVINSKFKIKKIHILYNSINKIGLEKLKKYNYEVLYTENLNENKEDYNYNYKKQHLKLIFILCGDDNYFVINSSANPSVSSRNESFLISNSKIKYDTILNSVKEFKLDKIKPKLPSKFENLVYLNNKGYTLLDFVNQVNKENKIKEITFIYYTAGKKFLSKLKEIIKNDTTINFFQALKIKKMLPDMFNMTNEMNKFYNGILKEEATHCKITLINNNIGNYIFISTANFNSNSRVEMHEVFNDKKMYNYIFNFYNKFFK